MKKFITFLRLLSITSLIEISMKSFVDLKNERDGINPIPEYP